MNDQQSAERAPHVHELLSDYLDGQLAEETRQQVAAHLETCPRCRADYESLRQTVRLLQQLPMRPVPRSFAITASTPPRRTSLFWLRVANGALAAVFIALLAARLVLPGIGRTSASQAVSPAHPVEPAARSVPVASPASPGVSNVARPAAGFAPVNRSAASVPSTPGRTDQTPAATSSAASEIQKSGPSPMVAAAPAAAARGATPAAAPMEAAAPAIAAAPTPIPVTSQAQSAPAPIPLSTARPVTQQTWPVWYDLVLVGAGGLTVATLVVVLLIGRRR